MSEQVIVNAYQLGLWYAQHENDVDFYEPVLGDYDYDYGFADDGWPIPPPCPVCGILYGACTTHYQ